MTKKRLIVVGDRVLVKLEDGEQRSKVGLYLPPTAVDNQAVQGGEIVATGPGLALPDLADQGDEPWRIGGHAGREARYVPMQASVGDYALFFRKAAVEITFENEQYLVVPQAAILALVREPREDIPEYWKESTHMMYPEQLLIPMRQELTRHGVEELKTVAEVDAKLAEQKGTALVVVNSVCGCAARNARPAIAMALQHTVKPDVSTTVFAGQDREATERARSYFVGYPPSSPSIALMKDGDVVFMLERYQIEGRSAQEIAADLTRAFDEHCVSGQPA